MVLNADFINQLTERILANFVHSYEHRGLVQKYVRLFGRQKYMLDIY